MPSHIFYAPHADDETLSMGPAVVEAVASGAQVALVLLTDGSAETAVLAALNGAAPCAWHGFRHDPEREAYPGGALDAWHMAQARGAEFARACAAFGVEPRLTRQLAHPDGGLTAEDARAAILELENDASLPPPRHHHTMSHLFDDHTDHLNAGRALRELVELGVVSSATWYVKRAMWPRLPHDARIELVTAMTAAAQTKIRNAVRAYMDYDPARARFGIGYHSVRERFDALLADFTVRRHGPDAAAL